tara:strand:- start:1627 stop:1794 length:168 start_codon:yes stop_codon:yes gene_type:complete
MAKETIYRGEKPNLDYTFYEKREQNQTRNHSQEGKDSSNDNKPEESKVKIITDHD